MSESVRTAEYPFHTRPNQVQADEDKRARDAFRAESADAERERVRPKLEALAAEIERLFALVPTESETRAAFEAERAKARAAEREAIRLELLEQASECERWDLATPAYVLLEFARRLAAPRDVFAGLDHGDLPGECPAILWHGPGHQSRARCQLRGPHVIHETVYGSHEQFARWEGERAFTGFSNEPPPEPRRQEKPR